MYLCVCVCVCVLDTLVNARAAVGTKFLSPYPPHTHTHGDPYTHGRPGERCKLAESTAMSCRVWTRDGPRKMKEPRITWRLRSIHRKGHFWGTDIPGHG